MRWPAQMEETLISATNKTTSGGLAAALVGWVNSSSFGMQAGILIGLVSAAVNWYYSHKKNQRAAEAHQAYMRSMAVASKPPVERTEADE